MYYVGDQSNPQHTTLRPIQEGKAPNYNVTWETAKKYNLGIDAKFFDDRLSFVFDIFKEMRSDILTDMVNYPSFVFPDFQTNASANGYHTLYRTRKTTLRYGTRDSRSNSDGTVRSARISPIS